MFKRSLCIILWFWLTCSVVWAACTDTEYTNTDQDHNSTLIFRQANSKEWWAGNFLVGGSNQRVCSVTVVFHTRTATTPSPDTIHAEIWTDSGATAPSAEITDNDSATQAFTAIATGTTPTTLTFTWSAGTGPQVTAATLYWVVIIRDWAASNTHSCTAVYGVETGRSYATYDEDATTWNVTTDNDGPVMSVYKETGGAVLAHPIRRHLGDGY